MTRGTRVAMTALAFVLGSIRPDAAHAALVSPRPAPGWITWSLEVAAIERFDLALSAWDLERARELAEGASSPLVTALQLGIVAVYAADYVLAEALLAGVLANPGVDAQQRADAEHHLALARGAMRALGEPVVVRSPDGAVEAVFADARDSMLAPYLFEAMAQARHVLAPTLGVIPDHPVRFEFLDNPAKLAMVTPLTLENIRTTGTVGVTKYRRIMMITPRVMLRGYGWIDTAVHEYVHYLLTLRTRNLAPVWMQEGLAKLLETRWRNTAAPELDAAIAYRLHQAIVRDDLVTLEQMYPSVAMLPSAELAALAYAEVETMLGLLHERRGDAGLALLLDAVAAGEDPQEALAQAWGRPFEDFMTVWKRVTQARTAGAEASEFQPLVFAEGEEAAKDTPPPLGDVFSHLGGGRARQHARLGALLHAREHGEAAAVQYEKSRAADARARVDPALCRRLGRLYVELGRFEEAIPVLELAARHDPDDANLAAAQGRALLRGGRGEDARAALMRAIRINPFIPEIHCDLAELAPDPASRSREQALCLPHPSPSP